ncbi:hypothetical protein B0T11DRAFT_287327 [Plectosphaerella cucumerina]|uniref:Uncharacterized protein n=1 Tax=Plectosphaerella cucumerina TaxID=40658 RepID=A0A8K0X076_9PEZI|nr:hypothetical protein B0T11DRAFT_287327 [Plectosphaerella cucumerina]
MRPTSSPYSRPLEQVCDEERPIPRSLALIAKAQRELLDKDKSWYSKLNDGRVGTCNIPANDFTSIADFHKARKSPPPGQKQPTSSTSIPNGSGNTERGGAQGEQANGGERSGDSSPEREIPWSQSPERRAQLPQSSNGNEIDNDMPSSPPVRPGHEDSSQQTPPTRSDRGQNFYTQAPMSSLPLPFDSSLATSAKPGTQLQTGGQASAFRQTLTRLPEVEFPRSSAESEYEVPMEIPGALVQVLDTPPVNRLRQEMARQQQTFMNTPPCGQGHLIQSTYPDTRPSSDQPLPTLSSSLNENPLPQQQQDMAKLPASNGRTPDMEAKKRKLKHLEFSSEKELDSEVQVENTPVPAPNRKKPILAQSPTGTTSPIASTFPVRTESLTTRAPTKKAAPEAPQPPKTPKAPAVEAPSVEAQAVKAMAVKALAVEKPAVKATAVKAPTVKSKAVKAPAAEAPAAEAPAAKAATVEATAMELDEPAQKTTTPPAPEAVEPPPALRTQDAHATEARIETVKTVDATVQAQLEPSPLPLVQPLVDRTKACDRCGTEVTVSNYSRHRKSVSCLRSDPNGRKPLLGPPQGPHLGSPQRPPLEPAAPIAARSSSPHMSALFWNQPFDAFCVAYPTFRGSIGDFVRACLSLRSLHRKSRLPVFLYDDFIRVFCGDYIEYIEGTSDDEPKVAMEWYVENVTDPVFTKRIVTTKNLGRVFKIHTDEFESASNDMYLSSPDRAISRRTSDAASHSRDDMQLRPLTKTPPQFRDMSPLVRNRKRRASVMESTEASFDDDADVESHAGSVTGAKTKPAEAKEMEPPHKKHAPLGRNRPVFNQEKAVRSRSRPSPGISNGQGKPASAHQDDEGDQDLIMIPPPRPPSRPASKPVQPSEMTANDRIKARSRLPSSWRQETPARPSSSTPQPASPASTILTQASGVKKRRRKMPSNAEYAALLAQRKADGRLSNGMSSSAPLPAKKP